MSSLPLNSKIENNRHTVIRVVHNRENPFVQLNKQTLWDKNLSLKAIGLWARCMSKPDNWRFCVSDLVKNCKEGRDAIYAIIKELIENNYAIKVEVRNEKSQILGLEYIFFEYPASEEEKQKQLEFFKKCSPQTDFPETDIPDLEKPTLLIKNITKKENTEKETTLPTTSANAESATSVASVCEFALEKTQPGNEKKQMEAKGAFSSEVVETTKAAVELLTQANEAYIPPKDAKALKPYYMHMRLLLETDKRKPYQILEVLKWALDNNEDSGNFKGWASIIYAGNPIKKLRDKYPTIYLRSKSKPKNSLGSHYNDEPDYTPCSAIVEELKKRRKTDE